MERLPVGIIIPGYAWPYFSALKGILGMTFPGTFLQVPFVENMTARRIVAWSSIGGSLALMAWGTVRRWRLPLVQLSAWYCALTLLALPFWFQLDRRYILMILPFIAVLIAQGGGALSEQFRWGKYTVRVLLAGWFILNGIANVENVRAALSAASDPLRRGPRQTFEWINNNLPADAALFSDQAPTVYLYTARKTLPYFHVKDEQDFLAVLARYQIVHVLFTPGSGLLMSDDALPRVTGRKIIEWVTRSNNFKMIYRNDDEHTEVHRRSG